MSHIVDEHEEAADVSVGAVLSFVLGEKERKLTEANDEDEADDDVHDQQDDSDDDEQNCDNGEQIFDRQNETLTASLQRKSKKPDALQTL